MDMLDEQIKNMPESAYPAGLHGRIMRRVAFLRFRAPFMTILGVLLFNLLISGWRLWTQAVEDETWAIFRSFFQSFEVSATFGAGFLQMLYDAVPVWALAVFLVNLALAVYVIYIYRSFRRLQAV